jgi:hypothetical protein
MKQKGQGKSDSGTLRWELVHAAGCQEEHCAAKWMLDPTNAEWLKEYNLTKPVSVPRSLRHLLGRYIESKK